MALKKRVLLVRMDKIGDLILAIPTDQTPALEGWEPTWLISKGCAFIPTHSVPPRRFFETEKSFSWSAFGDLYKKIRQLNPDLAIVLYAPWWIGLALWCAGVKRRFARRSRWHSWLFYNLGLRQSRKHGEHHETELNQELVEAALHHAKSSLPMVPALRLEAPQQSLEPWGLSPKGYFVVHPGMAGSALNWPSEKWAELITVLVKKGPVAITGTSSDRAYTEPLRPLLSDLPGVVWLTEKLNINELLFLLSQAKAVIAPSTGVLHLGASLGVPSVGIYSPIAVQRPTRWGPRGPLALAITPHNQNVSDLKAAATMEGP